MFKGYVYDVCSWGVTIHWKSGEVTEMLFNEERSRAEFWERLESMNIAPDYKTYKEG